MYFGGRLKKVSGAWGWTGLGRGLCCQITPHSSVGGGQSFAAQSCCVKLSCWLCPSSPTLTTSASYGKRANTCSQHPSRGLEAWGRKQRQAWEQTTAPVLGADVSGSYQPFLLPAFSRNLPEAASSSSAALCVYAMLYQHTAEAWSHTT